MYTCAICGEGNLSEMAVRTHMYVAHVCNEVACMFCDLRGVSAEEMNLHINTVHCSDEHCDDVSHKHFQHSNVASNIECQSSRLPCANSMPSNTNTCAGDQRKFGQKSLHSICTVNLDASSCCSIQEDTGKFAIVTNSCSENETVKEVMTDHPPLWSQGLPDTAVEDQLELTSSDKRFGEYI